MAERNRPHWSALLLGLSFGGFFDGILLHQILQWHHLLSAFDDRDVAFQVAADGYFHALMYLLAAVGVWGVWRGRARNTGRGLSSGMLWGFGVWHVVDSILSHWVTGIHRIRMDSPNPLVWDLIWFVAFGLLPILAGWVIGRGAREGTSGPDKAALAAIIVVVAAGALSLRPSGGAPFTTALFHSGVSSAQAMEAVGALGGQIVWIDTTGRLVMFERGSIANPLRLYASGAILVGGAGAPAGCLDWVSG